QQRLTLTALSKADYRLLSMFQVRYRYLHNLFDNRNKGQAILRRDQVLFFLLRDTTNAPSVTAWRDSDRHLPTTKKEVAGRRTRVVKCTMRVLRHDAVLWISSPFLAYKPCQHSLIEGLRMPLTLIIRL